VRYLVDANVLSEPTRPAPDPKVVEWLRRNERELAVDPIILGEVRFGILLLRKGKRRTSLDSGSTRALGGFIACRGTRKRACGGRSYSQVFVPPDAPCRSKTA
jgi:hypothetical protein